MNEPNTPFSTRLSGSAKELELRLRNIFQWKKKRPPVIFFLLAAVIALSCGSLVGFQAANAPEEQEQNPALTADFLGEIGKTFDRIQEENPGIEYRDAFIPDASGQCLGREGDRFYYYFFGTQDAPGLSDLAAEYGGQLKCAGIFTTVGELYPDLTEDLPLEQFFVQYGITEYTYTLEAQPDQGWIKFYDGKLQIWINTNEDDTAWENYVPTTIMKCDYPVLVSDKTIEDENYAIWEAVQPSWTRYTMTTSKGLTTVVLEEHPVAGYQARAVERIRVYAGDALIQTIETADLTYDGDWLYEGLFVAHGYEIGEPDIRDFNFDGSQDFGLMTTVTYPKNVSYGYFLWNDATEQFDFSFVLCAYLTVDEAQRQLYERVVGSDGWDEYNTYQFDSAGQLTLIGSRQAKPDDESLDAAEEESAFDGHELMLRRATIDGLSHMPLGDLPQEVLNSLTLVDESDLSISYNAEWGYYRTYTSPGLEVTTSAPSAAYLEYLRECGREESVEGEEGREWIIRATIKDDRYATLEGLKVGMTCAQAEAVGYSLRDGSNTIANGEIALTVTVEGDTVIAMETWWAMGRYIGKFFEL